MKRAPGGDIGIVQWISWASSFLALAISLLVAYFTSLSGPDIRVFVSAPQWVMRTIQIGDFPNQKSERELAIKLTCAFSNHGARSGVIEDIMLRLESEDDSTKWLFYPGVQVDDAKFLAADPKSLLGTVYPVSVPGKESQAITYLFLPMMKHPDFPFREVKPHKFQVAVLTRRSGERRWTTQQTFTDVLSQPTIDQIQTGTTMEQYPEEFDQLRRELK